MHVAAPDRRPTEGCVALDLQALTTILAECDPDEKIHIQLAT